MILDYQSYHIYFSVIPFFLFFFHFYHSNNISQKFVHFSRSSISKMLRSFFHSFFCISRFHLDSAIWKWLVGWLVGWLFDFFRTFSLSCYMMPTAGNSLHCSSSITLRIFYDCNTKIFRTYAFEYHSIEKF